MTKPILKLCGKLLLALFAFIFFTGCLPRVEFWIVNDSNAEYKIEILFKKKYTIEGFSALFGYKLDKAPAAARIPTPSYDDMFFRSDKFKKDPTRITESEFQYNPTTATFTYAIKAKSSFLLEIASDQEYSDGIELIQELKFISKDGEIIYRGREIRRAFLLNRELTLILR